MNNQSNQQGIGIAIGCERNVDPWAHRSGEMKCYKCMWFIEKVSKNFSDSDSIGRCRRHAPTMNGFPVVYRSDWCGDHKLDENKL